MSETIKTFITYYLGSIFIFPGKLLVLLLILELTILHNIDEYSYEKDAYYFFGHYFRGCQTRILCFIFGPILFIYGRFLKNRSEVVVDEK